jgi:hypothetical protein
MLTLIIVIVTFSAIAYYGRMAIEQPKPFVMDTDEKRITEMYGKTRDVKLRGFTIAGSAFEGKLVLTSKRLIYTRYDETRHALSITPKELISIEVGETGWLSKTPSLKISYKRSGRKKPKTITWAVPEKVKVEGMWLVFIKDKSYHNPNTPEKFARLLDRWRSGGYITSKKNTSKSKHLSTQNQHTHQLDTYPEGENICKAPGGIDTAELPTTSNPSGSLWKCSTCGEESEAQFTECWSCGKSRC